MIRLIYKSFFLAAGIVLASWIGLNIPPGKHIRDTNIFALPVKHQLLSKTVSPRMIFVGGSNISCSLNSQLIADSLHINPVNMGIHAGLGLKFMLRDILPRIQEGDVIVLSPEYQQFYGNTADGDIILLSAFTDVLDDNFINNWESKLHLLKYIPEYGASKLNPWNYFEKRDTNTIDLGDRRSFNKYGDASVHWGLPGLTVIPVYSINDGFNNSVMEHLKKFQDNLNQKKARLFITFPAYQASSYDIESDKIKTVERVLSIAGFSILGNPERYRIADSLMYNTPYHLNKKGVDYRTGLLIEDLKMKSN